MNEIDLHQFIKKEKLGAGSFAEVYKVQEKETGFYYAAKISKNSIDEIDIKDDSNEELISLKREVNIMAGVNHPAIVAFKGFSFKDFHDEPRPVIVTEFMPNGTLADCIEWERKSMAKWDDTLKLINIYGIASAMAYLHFHNIYHRDLKPGNILMDEDTHPKISDFGLSKVHHQNNESMTLQSIAAVKGTPVYISPEVWENHNYSKESDVYAFGLIVFEIITGQNPFQGYDIDNLKMKVIKGERPTFKYPVPECYQKLIENCWDQNPANRPSFAEIVDILKQPDFLGIGADEDEFLNYVDYIDECEKSCDFKKVVIKFSDYIKSKTKTGLNKEQVNDDKKAKTSNSSSSIVKSQNSHKKEILENPKEKTKTKHFSLFKKSKSKSSLSDTTNNKESNSIIIESENNPEKQFQAGKSYIEGKDGFPVDIEKGIKLLKKSIHAKNTEAAVYYSRMLIKGDIIIQNLPKAEKILKKHMKEKVPSVYLLYGKIMKKEKNYSKAFKYFEKASTRGNAEAMYNYAKMLFNGFGCQPNKKKAIQYVEMAKLNGYDRTDKFFAKLNGDDIYNYAMKLFTGNGTQINKEEAIKLFKLAIEKGNDNAMLKYAEIFENGDGVEESKKEALAYYKKAADKGHALGMLNYAKLLQDGIKESVNKEEVMMYYKMAADNGCDDAYEIYANLLMDGYGIIPNKKEAAKYYKIAADKGNKMCLAKYNQIMNELKNESISEPQNNAENQKTSNEKSSDIDDNDISDSYHDGEYYSYSDNQSNILTVEDRINLVISRIHLLTTKNEFHFKKIRIENVLNYKNCLKHNHETMFVNEFTGIASHLISLLVRSVAGDIGACQKNGSIPFSYLSVNLLFDCSISNTLKMYNIFLLNAFSYALHFLGVNFAISIVADSKFKIFLKSFEEPFSKEVLQRVLDCCLIPRHKANYAEIFYQFIQYMKTYEKDRINKNSDIEDYKPQRAFFLFTDGINESLISFNAWKKSILNESDNSFGIIASVPNMKNQDQISIKSVWDNFTKETQDASSTMCLTSIKTDLNNPETISLICNCFMEVLARAKKVQKYVLPKPYKKPSFICKMSNLENDEFKLFKINISNQNRKSIYYNINKTNSPNKNLQLEKVDIDHFVGKTGKIISCNICQKYKEDFQTYINQTTNALKNFFRTQLDTIFKPNTKSSTDICQTRNYGVTVVIDASLSCFNFLTTNNSLNTVICLLCALLSAEIPCVDIILSTKNDPIIFCSDVPSVGALSEKSAIWPALFSFFSKEVSSNCDLESAIHAAYDLQRMRSIKRTSFLFVFTDGLYMDGRKHMIKDQVMLAAQCGINVIGIGIGNYPIGIKDIFEQYVNVIKPEEIINAISCLFGDENPDVIKDIKPMFPPSSTLKEVCSVLNKFKEIDDNPMFKELKEKLSNL